MPHRKFDTFLKELTGLQFNPLELLSRRNLEEKLIELLLEGFPAGPARAELALAELVGVLNETATRDVRVVVFGGGTGLSNVIGGDSRRPEWPDNPFFGLKTTFPHTRSIVCVTDDGGSTGELLKDLSVIAVGDLRHVLLSSIQLEKLKKLYGISIEESREIVTTLHRLLNHRYTEPPWSIGEVEKKTGIDFNSLPEAMREPFSLLFAFLWTDEKFKPLLRRPHCLGNLLLVGAMYFFGNGGTKGLEISPQEQYRGIRAFSEILGAHTEAVFPCTTTPSHLKMLYTNGVLVTGESKSSEADRGYPVDRVFVEFSDTPHILPETLETIAGADIIIFAPGSLYTSVIPIMQTPELADAVRRNRKALKLLVANLWVQRGETDLALEDPQRRFYISDLIKAYNRNIPNGVAGLFNHVLVLGLQNIPASILQRYAVEEKVPIYLDRGRVWEMGFTSIEAKIFSQNALEEHQVVQHDPEALSIAIKTMWTARGHLRSREPALNGSGSCPSAGSVFYVTSRGTLCSRRQRFRDRLKELPIDNSLRKRILEILWRHQDIPYEHFEYIDGIARISPEDWNRSQRWDNIYSFYDPADRLIKIHEHVDIESKLFEAAFLIALGESLLGDYALSKETVGVEFAGEEVGKIYRLTLRDPKERHCYLMESELDRYLVLSRMVPGSKNGGVYTRLVNGREGFTPPGLLFGLIYTWYLDNSFASHIEYKMAIIRGAVSDLIPEQVKMLGRRKAFISYFRESVFKQKIPGE